ncbi:MAG: hypothetical protein MI700_05025, partial [Balneolales bacterium]|nr:hypothetical protein [Balneolales bacterium]
GIVVSILAGIYPALFLSRFRPIEVLKGRMNTKKDASLFRTGMVVFQFTMSIFLIASTMIIGNQLDFMRSKSLGYQPENVIVLQVDDNPDRETGFTGLMERTHSKADLLRSELNSIPEVNRVAISMYTPADNGWISVDYRDEQGKVFAFNVNFVGMLFPKLLDLAFVEGRDFSTGITSDAQKALIVNEAFVTLHGWEDPLNAQLHSPQFIDHEIIGVVENFNYSSLRNDVEPLAIAINPMVIFSGIDNVGINSTSPRISISVESTNIPATISSIESAWEKILPGEPFNFSFLDEAVDAQYRQEERLARIISFGATFAIIIACMGLFGLASLMIVRRTKEIGIRKVLGASSSRILILVNKEFSFLVLYALLLAAPLIWFGMNFWLNDFAYRIEINFWTIGLSGVIALGIAWLTIGIHLYRAVTVNPVNSLKTE